MNGNWWRSVRLAWGIGLAALVGGGGLRLSAQDPAPAPTDEPVASSESSAHWEYQLPVPLPATPALPNMGPAHVDFLLNPEVFAHGRVDLADLRLFDASEKEVPYAFRVLQARSERERLFGEEFNRTTSPTGVLEVSLELKQDNIWHDEVEIVTDGQEFRRAVAVDGSDDGKAWHPLAKGSLVRFTRGETKLDGASIFYPLSRYKYIRVQVHPDPVAAANDQPETLLVRDVSVRRRVEVPGENLTLEGKLSAREPVRTYSGPGSAWTIDLGGEQVPCSELHVDIAEADFNRDVEVEYEIRNEVLGNTLFVPVPLSESVRWQRVAGDKKEPMVVQFGEVQTRRIRLRVTDYRNPPLTVRSVKCIAAARQIVFARPPEGSTVRLVVGNPLAEPPGYDYARNLPAKIEPVPARVTLGPAERNPAFVPPPQPFTERFPWLIYVVLGAVSVVLAAVIASLARTSLAIHDQGLGATPG